MKSRGFTLLEVLIALAIVAMSVGALLGTITSSASNVAYLKDKTLAEWVALNRLTEIRISQQMPDPGKRAGNAELGGMRWDWEPERNNEQTEAETRAVDSALANVAWTTTVTGVIGRAGSDRREAIATPYRGLLTTGGPSDHRGDKTPDAPGDTTIPGAPGAPRGPDPNPPTPDR
jgi:general secretion pathway protein I